MDRDGGIIQARDFKLQELGSLLDRKWPAAYCREFGLDEDDLDSQQLTYTLVTFGQKSKPAGVSIPGDSVFQTYNATGLVQYKPGASADGYGFPNGDSTQWRALPQSDSYSQFYWNHLPFIQINDIQYTDYSTGGDYATGIQTAAAVNDGWAWTVPVDQGGPAFVMYNDDNYSDNSGDITFVITIVPPARFARDLLRKMKESR